MADNGTLGKGTLWAPIGAGIAAAGAAAFLLTRRSADAHDDGINISDAPEHVFRREKIVLKTEMAASKAERAMQEREPA